ncbi:MAG: hypothetical protein QG638_527 [Pseudomonadota bacterium]|nr:hypothetical protein [Pseudomonadota bacterium]MDQ5917108.1 hypothetical protein [Pseudomonadota bacterium]MDQ5945390.1 hypothetical protein [Pseudomonadota bacterium]
MVDYLEFLKRKSVIDPDTGLASVPALNPMLYPHQSDMVKWALRRGRAALFADCGIGKGPMQMEWADKQPHECIIAAPLAVAHQFVREAEKFGIQLSYAKEQSEIKNRITVTNYERLENFHLEQFGAVALDECFPSGTLIDCVIDGKFTKKHIEEVKIGDSIVNAVGVDRVSDVHRREVQYAIKVNIKDRSFISSPNHPIFTQRGWVGAQDLRPGDYALESGEAVSLVRSGVFSEISGSESSEVLRDILLSEMADDSAGNIGEGSFARSGSEARREEISMASIERPEGHQGNGEDNVAESDIKRGNESENLPHIESHEAQTFRTWWKREGHDGAASVLDGVVAARMDSGICLVTGETKGRLSNLLQTRLSEQRNASVHRGGWVLARSEEGSGREENSRRGIFRVEGIEVLEQGNPELEGFRNAEGRIYFYDLGATRHPSFSVNGLLVHNSSILKNYSGAYSTWMIEAFKNTPFRLCSSATPAPNDVMELGTQAEFLGVMTRGEMLAMYFTHDGGDTSKWRVKGHAHAAFWTWMAAWAVMIRKPSDLGYSDEGFILPPLHIHEHCVQVHAPSSGFLFAVEAQTLQERQAARRDSIGDRVAACAALVNESDRPFLVWCNLNAESEALAAAIPDAIEVQGSDSDEHKEAAITGFLEGRYRVMISKPKIAGLGLNLQHCADMAFVGLSDSYEQLYQSIRRCWRFGQTKPVNVHVITAETEGAVVSNIKRKEREAEETYNSMIEHMKDLNAAALHGGQVRNKSEYRPAAALVIPNWLEAA